MSCRSQGDALVYAKSTNTVTEHAQMAAHRYAKVREDVEGLGQNNLSDSLSDRLFPPICS